MMNLQTGGADAAEQRSIIRATHTVEEAAAILGISRQTAYAGCRSGDIPCVRIGKRMLVPAEALARILSAGR
jgi:excisionase family DNA binding protein